MNRMNLLPRLAAVALAAVLAVAAGATALSQLQSPTVEVIVAGAMAGDEIATGGTSVTADMDGEASFGKVSRAIADGLGADSFTLNGEAATVSGPDKGTNRDGDDTYTFTIQAEDVADPPADPDPPAAGTEIAPSVKIKFLADADDEFPGTGSSVDVLVTVTDATLVSLAVNGGLDFYTTTNGARDSEDSLGSTINDAANLTIAQDGTEGRGLIIVVPPGTPDGEYTVTALARYVKTVRGEDVAFYTSGTKQLTVGKVDEVDSVVLELSSPRRALDSDDDENEDGYADDATTSEKGSIPVGSPNNTELSLKITNSNGKPSEASSITSIVVSTTNGTLSVPDDMEYTCDTVSLRYACEIEIDEYRQTYRPVPSAIRVLLTAAEQPGEASVSATVHGLGIAPITTEAVVVKFVGPATALEAEDASGTVLGYNVGDDVEDKGADARDQITFAVSATDKVGNAAMVPTLSAKLTDPDGVTVAPGKYEVTQSGATNGTLEFNVETPKAKALAAGTYTLALSGGGVKLSVNPVVVGTADKVMLELSNDAPSDEDELVATVTVTDAAGENVADGTQVTFSAPDLTGDDDDVVYRVTGKTVSTDDGMASATYIVVGPGRAVLTAMADGKVGHDRLVSTVGAAPAADCSTAGIDGLSATSGFATWSHSCDTSASALFDVLSARGATAIHLWNGTSWVRYSVVDGEEVPGSSDFSVMDGDILYISN